MNTYFRKKLLICFLMNARRPRNLPYILCNTVLRKSRSRGSSLSNSSRSCSTNFWSITFLPILGWKSGDSRKRKKNSYTSCEKKKIIKIKNFYVKLKCKINYSYYKYGYSRRSIPKKILLKIFSIKIKQIYF